MGIFLDIGRKQKDTEDHSGEELTWHLGKEICRMVRLVESYFWSLERIRHRVRDRSQLPIRFDFPEAPGERFGVFWARF